VFVGSIVEALEQVREKEEIAGQKGRDPLGVSDWEGVEIEFLSEERGID